MSNKPTPGDWRYLPEFSAICVVSDHKLKTVADFGVSDLSPDEDEANATLMASSKKLLEALEQLTSLAIDFQYELGENHYSVKAALKIIAEAKGDK